MLAVLAMATAANADLVLDPVEADMATGLNIQTDPIDVAAPQQAIFLAVGGGGGAIDAGTALYTGDLSAIWDLSADPDLAPAVEGIIGEAPTRIDMIELFSSAGEPPPLVGVVVSYAVTAEPAGVGTPVYMLNGDTLEIMGTATIVPEPITIALLGLGGLFLRRRK